MPRDGELADRRCPSRHLREVREQAAWERLRNGLATASGGVPADVATRLAAAAYRWQATALAFGPLALAAPIAATDVVFALALAAWWSRQRLHKRDWSGCGLVVEGAGCFLAASPAGPVRRLSSGLAGFAAVTVIAAWRPVLQWPPAAQSAPVCWPPRAAPSSRLAAAVTLSFARLLSDVGLVPARQLGALMAGTRAGSAQAGGQSIPGSYRADRLCPVLTRAGHPGLCRMGIARRGDCRRWLASAHPKCCMPGSRVSRTLGDASDCCPGSGAGCPDIFIRSSPRAHPYCTVNGLYGGRGG